jgi:hypothetical protein
MASLSGHGLRSKDDASVRHRSFLAVALVCALSACSRFAALRPFEEPRPDPFGVVLTAPPKRIDDPQEGAMDPERVRADLIKQFLSVPPFDPRRMQADLEEQFPGLETIDFVRALLVPNERSGKCWTQLSPLWETKIDVDYSIDGKKGKASGIQELKDNYWWPTYSSPLGYGVERRAEFDAIDLKVATTLTCHCAAQGGVRDGGSRGLELRFRWTEGKMPEVSAVVVDKGSRRVLAPKITYGHLMSYDFEATGTFPEGDSGRCAAHATVAILNDPPIL